MMIKYFIRKVLPTSIVRRTNCRHGHGSQQHARHESSSKSNSLHIELSFPIYAVINVPALYTEQLVQLQIRRQNIFTQLNCQRHCASRLNPRPAFSIRSVCPYGKRIDYVRHFKVASFAAIVEPRVFPSAQMARYNWLFLMTVPLSRWRGWYRHGSRQQIR